MKGRYVWHALRRWWWLPALAALLAATTGYGISSRLPRVYEGRARLQVTPAQVSSRSTDYSTVLGAEGLTRTYAEMLRSRAVVEAALGATGLEQQYEGALHSITVTALRDTQLIEIRARANGPEQASQLANALADVFVQQLRDAQATRFAATRQALGLRLDQLATSIAGRSERVATLQAEPPTAERDTALAQAESELVQLQPSYSAASESYQNVLLAEVRDHDLLETVERATPATTPVEPRVLLNVVLAGLAGLLVGLALILLIEAVDDRVSSAERLRSAADVSWLGTLALPPRRAALALDDGSVASARDHAHVTELFRSLLARLCIEPQDQPSCVLLVTGCRAGAGTTSVAIGLARTAAQAGQRVVLVDANLRAACPTAWPHAPTGAGLAAILADAHLSVHDVLFPSGIQGMWLLPGGPPPPDPGALLASRRTAQRVGELRTYADLVVIDAAPALASNDAALLARYADATLLVVDTRRTHAPQVKRAAALLRETGAHLVGAVLNRVPPSSTPFHDNLAPRRPRPPVPASALGAGFRPWPGRMRLTGLGILAAAVFVALRPTAVAAQPEARPLTHTHLASAGPERPQEPRSEQGQNDAYHEPHALSRHDGPLQHIEPLQDSRAP